METKKGKLDFPHFPILHFPIPNFPIILTPGLVILSLHSYRWQTCNYSAKGLTISSHRAQHAAISMEKVNGKVQAFLRPRTGGKDQIFIPLRVQKQLPSAG